MDQEIKLTPRAILCGVSSFLCGRVFLVALGADLSWSTWWIYALSPIAMAPGMILWTWPALTIFWTEAAPLVRALLREVRRDPWPTMATIFNYCLGRRRRADAQ